MDNSNYTPPQSDLEANDNPTEPVLASRGRRFGASLIDGLIFIPITVGAMYLTGGFDSIANGEQPSFGYSLLLSAITLCIFIALNGHFLLRDGQTLGKKALGIKIVTQDDLPVALGGLCRRYAVYWGLPLIPVIGAILNLINLLVIFGDSHRCGHDRVGGTKVIEID